MAQLNNWMSRNSPTHIKIDFCKRCEGNEEEKLYWSIWTSICKNVNLDSYVTIYTRINSKYYEPKYKTKTVQFLEVNIREYFCDSGLHRDFFSYDTKILFMK